MTKYDSQRELIARAIIVEGDCVLVNQGRNGLTGEAYCALPGGHVDPGESCAEAVCRELQEELAASIEVGELCLVSESIYPGRHQGDRRRHELVLYFNARLTGPLTMLGTAINSPEKEKRFCWLPLRDVNSANLLPRAARTWLQAPQTAPRYVFNDATN